MKKCVKCGIVKNEFDFRKSTIRTFRSACKKCDYNENKKWIKNNKEKMKILNKRHYLKHKGKINAYNREYSKKYYLKNKERLNKKHKQYDISHKEEIKIRKKRHREENKERIDNVIKAYRIKNKEKIRERNRKYEKEHPEKVIVKNCRRRALRRGNGGSFTKKEWLELKVKYNNTCPSCGKSEPEIKLTADHIVPLSKGGSGYINNIQPLCIRCNSEKFVKTIYYKII